MLILITGNSKVGKDTLAQGLAKYLVDTCNNKVIVTHVIARLKKQWQMTWGFDPDSREHREMPASPFAPRVTPGMTWGQWMMNECLVRKGDSVARLKDVLCPALEEAYLNSYKYDCQIITGLRHCDELETYVKAAQLLHCKLVVFNLVRDEISMTTADEELANVNLCIADLARQRLLSPCNLRNGTAQRFLHTACKHLEYLSWLDRHQG